MVKGKKTQPTDPNVEEDYDRVPDVRRAMDAEETVTEGDSSAAVPLEVPSYEIEQADAFEWLAALPEASVDLVLTDPPYKSLEKYREIGTTTRLKAAWFDVIENERFVDFFRLTYRVLKPGRHCYVMCDAETMFEIKPMAEEIGFKFWKPIVWDKVTISTGYHYRNRHEFILFFEKGRRPWDPMSTQRWAGGRQLNDKGMSDILQIKRVRDGYPTEKPVELNRALICQSTKPGELVIDPFMGSGSSGEAALTAGREYMGCDAAEAALAIATPRLAAVHARLDAVRLCT